MKYDWILFDIDETLLRFNSYDALQFLFSSLHTPFTEVDFLSYEAKNKLLWESYQNGHITIKQLQHDRFSALGERFNKNPLDLNATFLEAISHVSMPLDGAINLLDTLKGKAKLGVITNGFTATQEKRIINNGMHHHFDFIVTSESAGVAKPQPAIFDHAFSLMANPNREKVLMIGDTLESDILGGINAGIHTCWLNPYKKIAPDHITPHFEITSLPELENIL
ncbi:MAG: pyrimidine 5'-nucleotidase [Coxiellaceae bacterium]|nr:pyrimidine 5'-nucleotidase [Coxiellaceae bacterium]